MASTSCFRFARRILRVPATNAFLAPHQALVVRSCAPSSSIIAIRHMSDGDWHADYNQSKYDRQSNNNYDNGYDARRDSGRGSGRGGDGGGRSGDSFKKHRKPLGPNGHDYQLSNDATSNNSRFSESDIHALLADRLQAKFARDFQTADNIQKELIDGGVSVHEGLKEWRADGIVYRGTRGGARKADNQRYSKSHHSVDVDGASDSSIDKLVQERAKFKMMRQFEKADEIRDGLRTKFNVLVDDRLKQWSVSGDFGEERNAQRELAEKVASRGFIKSSSSLSLNEEEEEYIRQHVEARVVAKKERDFDTADKIRLDLAQKFDVTIRDNRKLWSIGGVFEEEGGTMGKPKGVYTRQGGGELSSEDEDAIAKMLMDRYHAKKLRNYDAADGIEVALLKNYNVIIDDGSSVWRVDTGDYVQAGGENTLSQEDVEYIDAKCKERFRLKRQRLYNHADAIRDDLRGRFGIKIDDRAREWMVDNELSEEKSIVG